MRPRVARDRQTGKLRRGEAPDHARRRTWQSRYLNNRAEVSHQPTRPENGRCSISSRLVTRNVFCPPTAEFTIIFSFAVIAFPQPNIALLATGLSAPGVRSPE